MTRIVLACAFGMSTSMLVQRMQEEAAKQGLEADIRAISETDVKRETDNMDVLLLGLVLRVYRRSMLSTLTILVGSIGAFLFGVEYQILLFPLEGEPGREQARAALESLYRLLFRVSAGASKRAPHPVCRIYEKGGAPGENKGFYMDLL